MGSAYGRSRVRSQQIELLPLVTPAGADKGSADGYFGPTRHFLEVEVIYSKGGTNYFSGGSKPRGYYLMATPITLQTTNPPDGPKGETKGFMMFSGQGVLLEEAKAFSPKALARVADAAKTNPQYEDLKRSVIEKQNLTLAASEAA